MNRHAHGFRWTPQRSAGTLLDMAEVPRVILGMTMAQRRRQLGLSITKAAAAAGIDRATWTSAENGTRTIAVHNRAGVERALGWAAGSVDAVLEGSEPADLPPPTSPVSDDPKLAAEVERIQGLPLPAADRIRMIRALVDLYEEQAREGRRTA